MKHWDNFCFWWWRLRVCLVGLRWHQTWVWHSLEEKEWREGYDDEPCAEDYYVEGWCRDVDLDSHE